jgi:hypothetical protein
MSEFEALREEIRETHRLIEGLHETLRTVANQSTHVIEAINRQGTKQRRMVRAMTAASHAFDLELDDHANGNGNGAAE